MVLLRESKRKADQSSESLQADFHRSMMELQDMNQEFEVSLLNSTLFFIISFYPSFGIFCLYALYERELLDFQPHPAEMVFGQQVGRAGVMLLQSSLVESHKTNVFSHVYKTVLNATEHKNNSIECHSLSGNSPVLTVHIQRREGGEEGNYTLN